MKIQYMAEGSDDCPLVRLFDFDEQEISLLHERLCELGEGSGEELELDAFPWVKTDGQLRLVFAVTERDVGINHDAAQAFVCRLTKQTWEDVAGLTEPFLRDVTPGRHQWLDRTGDISLLLSPDGSW